MNVNGAMVAVPGDDRPRRRSSRRERVLGRISADAARTDGSGQVRGRSRGTIAPDRGPMDDLWKLLHILSGFALVAGIIGRSITVAEARRADDVGRIEPSWARRGGSSGSWCNQARSR